MKRHSHTLTKQIAHVIDVDMGYGHSRAAYALKDLSHGNVITASAYQGMPSHDRTLWRHWRESYETLSRLRPVPVIGKLAFEIVEKAQEIPDFYPRRDLSATTFALNQAMHLIENKGLGRHLVTELNKNPLPAVCTHPVPAFALETFGYKGDIWCVPTDADVARAWVSTHARQSRIRYFCANGRLMERLQLYGVASDRLFLTGFPLPKELIGGPTEPILKANLQARLTHLDPLHMFSNHYHDELEEYFGKAPLAAKPSYPLTITYAVGGAGAQKAIGKQIIESLRTEIRRKTVRVILVAGTRRDVADYYARSASDLGIDVPILYARDRRDYFAKFTAALSSTDILWTKPSELAFYTALGLPILMAPPLGRQEEFNAVWLSYVGGGVVEDDVRYTNEWLFDWLNSGGFARAAWQGYVNAPTNGTYRIEDIILGRETELRPLPTIV